jgi:hypothetical protein
MLFRSTRSQGGAGPARDGIRGDSDTDAGYFSGPEDPDLSGPESTTAAVQSPPSSALHTVPAIPQAVVQAVQAAHQSDKASSTAPPAAENPSSPNSKPGLLARTLLGRRQHQRKGAGGEGGVTGSCCVM